MAKYNLRSETIEGTVEHDLFIADYRFEFEEKTNTEPCFTSVTLVRAWELGEEYNHSIPISLIPNEDYLILMTKAEEDGLEKLISE